MDWTSIVETVIGIVGGGTITILAALLALHIKDVRDRQLRIAQVYTPLATAHGDLESKMTEFLHPIPYHGEYLDQLPDAQELLAKCLAACRPIALVDPNEQRCRLLVEYRNCLNRMVDIYEGIDAGILDPEDDLRNRLDAEFEPSTRVLDQIIESVRSTCVLPTIADLIDRS